MTCKAQRNMIPLDNGFGRLITTNTEIPGTDCMVTSSQNFLQHWDFVFICGMADIT